MVTVRTSGTQTLTRFCQVAVPVPLRRTFTYQVPEDMEVKEGSMVTVSFGRRTMTGFVVGFGQSDGSLDHIKPIKAVESEDLSLPPEVLELCRWVSDYYLAPLGEVARTALPAGLGKRTPDKQEAGATPSSEHHTLSTTQEQALNALAEALSRRSSKPFLLHGVTGSGKTEVYLRAAEQAVENGGSVILLIPEIALSPQMIHRVESRFGNRAALWHSSLTATERRRVWTRARQGELNVIVGARSAVFSPLPNLRLLIVDEEHETSYKQTDSPRYHARDVAVVRAQKCGAVTVLGSATPSLESYANVQNGKYTLLEMPGRVTARPRPQVELVSLPKSSPKSKPMSWIFSNRLREEIAGLLSREEQGIVFLNRRGHSTVVRCSSCGEVERCRDCDIVLTYHATDQRLWCHYCGHRRRKPPACAECGELMLAYRGAGTQKVEEELFRLFPGARVQRIDTDSTRKRGSLQQALERFREGSADLLLGTQMVAKGLDFPQVTLVGVVHADTQLNLPDFRSGERTFQLLTQVAGRAGRGEKPGKVILQTDHPDHPSLVTAKTHDYHRFFKGEAQARKELGWPPYSRLVNILFDGRTEQAVQTKAEEIFDILRFDAQTSGVELLGPAPQPVSKLKGKFRWHLTLRSPRTASLRTLADRALTAAAGKSQVRVSVDVDPVSLL